MNKLIRKLTLSGVTLGVAALSLTTSTYAWFTTNTQATASGVSGSVEVSGGNMLIKTLNYWNEDTIKDSTEKTTADTWSDFASTVTLHAKDEVKMNPVTYTVVPSDNSATSTPSSSGFYKGTDGGTTFTTSAEKTDYLHYKIIFALSSLATGEGITNKVTMKVSDFNKTTAAEGSQYLLVDADASGAKAGNTIKVNLLDVLSMRVESKVITSSDASTNSAYGITSTDIDDNTGTLTASNACYRYRAESDSVSIVGGTTANADALTYYNNVYNLKGDGAVSRPTKDNDRGYLDSTTSPNTLVSTNNNAEQANEITLFTVTGTAKAYVMCDIYFYIDGWDKQCFNAAGGLSLTEGNLEFKLNTTK